MPGIARRRVVVVVREVGRGGGGSKDILLPWSSPSPALKKIVQRN